MDCQARRLCLVLLFGLLLASCATAPGNANGQSTPSAKTITYPQKMVCPSQLAGVSYYRACLTPQDMRTLYGLDPLYQQGFTGKGQTVIDIVSFGSPNLQHDMQVFDQTFGLPPIDLQVISPLNVPESDPQHDKGGWGLETELDVEIIHALAPEAKVVVLTSPVSETEGTIGLPEFRQLIQYAIDHKLGTIISQSWGASELTLTDEAGKQEMSKWNTLLQDATTKQHLTIFSSSGDNGATDYADVNHSQIATIPTTSFSADSPWVTSVGGTRVQHSTSGLSEVAWESSGGGFSRFYQTPSYQQSLAGSQQNLFQNRRGVPDVSAAGDPSTGMAIYINGQWSLAGGTSASTPVWAALMAVANQKAGHPLGFINPALYQLGASSTYAQDFHDVTEGNNSNVHANTVVQGYSASTGWDAVTGLGTPNAANLIPDLIAAVQTTK